MLQQPKKWYQLWSTGPVDKIKGVYLYHDKADKLLHLVLRIASVY